MENKARIYAKALYKLTKDRTDEIKEKLEFSSTVFKKEKNLGIVLFHPQVSASTKEKLLSLLSCDEKDGIFYQFLFLLYTNKELNLLAEITKEYNKLKEKEYEEVEVITPAPLEEEAMQELNNKINSWIKDKPTKLKFILDPSLIGGVKIKIKDKVIDCSLDGYFVQMKQYILEKT